MPLMNRKIDQSRNGQDSPREESTVLVEALRGTASADVPEALNSIDPTPGIRLSEVQPEPVVWTWPARIPKAKVTLLDGDPGNGKSVVTMDLTARVTRGWPMPFCKERMPPACVLLMNAEDGLADTIRPRLEVAGADLSKVFALQTLPGDDGEERAISLPGDTLAIQELVHRIGAAMVVIDPLMAFLTVDSHKDQEVRRALHPLARLAENTGAAVLVVRHLNKMPGGNPLYRGGGSIGIIGAARSAMLAAPDPDNPDRRILAPLKSNLAKLPPALAYALEDVRGILKVVWQKPTNHTAAELLRPAADDGGGKAVAEAVAFLRSLLAKGSKPAAEVFKEAAKVSIAAATLKRAKSKAGVESTRQGGSEGQWVWGLAKEDQTGPT